MFKVCLLLCVVGLVAAVAPPTISLELAADLTKHSNTPGIVKGAQRFHKDASPVLSCKTSVGFQDYTQTCQASKVGGKIHKCRLPTARAYDHFDKQVPVNTRYFLVDTDGSKKGNDYNEANTTSMATTICTYLSQSPLERTSRLAHENPGGVPLHSDTLR